jgi:hypothetical protein
MHRRFRDFIVPKGSESTLGSLSSRRFLGCPNALYSRRMRRQVAEITRRASFIYLTHAVLLFRVLVVLVCSLPSQIQGC